MKTDGSWGAQNGARAGQYGEAGGKRLTLGVMPFLALSAALSSAAYGQTPAESEEDDSPAGSDRFGDDTLDLAPISIIGEQERNIMTRSAPLRRMPTSVQDTPQVINVIPRAVLDERQAVGLTDAIRYVPGVTLNAGEGGGSTPRGDNFNIRGFSAQGDVFADGLRDIGLYNRDTFNLESVEVVKGSSGSYFGRGSGGGSINLTTKKPQPDRFANFDATIGTDSYYRGTADVNVPIDEWSAFRINAVGMDREFAGRDMVEMNRWGIAPSLTMGMNTGTTVTASYMHQRDDNVPENGVPYFDGLPITEQGVPRSNWYGYLDDFEKMRADVATLEIEHVANDWLTLSNATRIGDYFADRWTTVGQPGLMGPNCPVLVPGCTMTGHAHQARALDAFTVQNQTSANANFATGFLRHEMVASVDLNYEDYGQQNYSMVGALPSMDVFNPAYEFSGQRREKNTRLDSEVRSVGLSLYDRVEFAPGFFAIGNVRYEHYDIEGVLTDRNGIVTDEGEGSFGLWTFQGALQWKPRENQTYYVSVGSAELPLYDPKREYSGFSELTSDPEKVITYEVGGKVNILDDRLGLGASVFRIERTNMRSEGDAGDPVQILDGERIVTGFEVQADGQITDRWNVMAGYAFLDSEIVNPGNAIDGNRMPLVPKHSGFVWTSYDVSDRFTLGGGISVVGERFANDQNTNELPSHFQVDALASYQVNDKLKLQINAFNLTDERGYERSHPARQAYPITGRTVLFTTSLSF